MSNNNRNRGRNFTPQAKPAAVVVASTPSEEPTVSENPNPTEKTVEVIGDDVTKSAQTPSTDGDNQDGQTNPPGEDEEVETSVLTVTADDDQATAKLKGLLTAWRSASLVAGRDVAHFKEAGVLSGRITRAIIDRPIDRMLDTLLAFFEEEKDGVCRETESAKGVLNLPQTEAMQAAFLWTLFTNMATKNFTRVDGGQVLNVLKRQEILTYYNRRAAAAAQAA